MKLSTNRIAILLLLAPVFLVTTAASAGGIIDWTAGESLDRYKEPSIAKAGRYSFAHHTRVLSAQMILGQGQRTAETIDARMFSLRTGGEDNASRTPPPAMIASKGPTPLDVLHAVSTSQAGRGKPGMILWGSFYGGTSRYQGHDGRDGFQACTHGATIGIEYNLTEDFLVGFLIAYERSRLKFGQGATSTTIKPPGLFDPFIIAETQTETGGSASMESLRFGPYASKRFGLWFVNASITAGLHQVKYQRGMLSAGTQTGAITGTVYNTWADGATVKGRYDAWDIALSGTVGRDIPLSSNDTLSPFTTLTYAYINQDSFDETGDVSLARKFESTQETALISYLGARYRHTGELCGMPLAVNLNAAWAHQWFYGDEQQVARGTVTNTAYGSKQRLGSTTKDYVVYGASVEMPISENTSLSVGYNGQYGTDHITHFGSISLRIAL